MNARSFVFGQSALGTPIFAHSFGVASLTGGTGADAQKKKHLFVLGGVHGNEPEGVIAALGLMSRFAESFPFQLRATVVPQFNIDGVIAGTRVNGRGVDLNRNLPTKDWDPKAFTPKYLPGPFANSEPENQALTRFLRDEKPDFVLSLHSWHPVLNVNEQAPGLCRRFTDRIAAFTGYPIADTIGYPTPGCLGTYAGFELGIPTLTYEIERGLKAPAIFSRHVPAILEAMKVLEA